MEAEFIAWLRGHLPPHPQMVIGPGDDAAVLALASARDIVVTTDMLTDGVDFRLQNCEPWQIGRKAVAVNLSDLAAMAARPLAIVISVALPRVGAGDLARGLYRGVMDIARKYDVAIAGGDTNTWDGGLVVSITALGQLTPRGPLRRSGAQPGDYVLVTGRFGGSLLGKHFAFEPRVHAAMLLHRQFELHAGIDVSDGLSLDLARLAAASGCGAAIQLDAVPIDPAARELAARGGDGRSPLEHALSDGEDFELILVAPPAEAARMLDQQPLEVPLTHIGHITAEPGLWQVASDGWRAPLTPRGYEHRGEW